MRFFPFILPQQQQQCGIGRGWCVCGGRLKIINYVQPNSACALLTLSSWDWTILADSPAAGLFLLLFIDRRETALVLHPTFILSCIRWWARDSIMPACAIKTGGKRNRFEIEFERSPRGIFARAQQKPHTAVGTLQSAERERGGLTRPFDAHLPNEIWNSITRTESKSVNEMKILLQMKGKIGTKKSRWHMQAHFFGIYRLELTKKPVVKIGLPSIFHTFVPKKTLMVWEKIPTNTVAYCFDYLIEHFFEISMKFSC